MSKAGLLTAFAMVSLATFAQAQAEPRVYSPQFDNEARANDDVPRVQVWLDDTGFRYGEVIRPYVVTEPGAYLTIARITTDGALEVLYPREPREQRPYSPAHFSSDRVPVTGARAYQIRESRGNGFVFAIASYYRFNYESYSNRGFWSDSRLVSAARYGSPFQIIRAFVEEITEGSSSYSMDYVMYDVGGDSYRSRYAYRYRNYAFNDYYDLCLNAFDRYYNGYCSGYGYYYPYAITRSPGRPGNPPDPSVPGHPRKAAMRIKRPTVDPVVPHVPETATQGRYPSSEPRIYRPEARVIRPEPRVDQPRAERPRVEQPRPEPQRIERFERPRIEQPRPQPPVQAQPRIEVRRADPAPQRIEKQKDN